MGCAAVTGVKGTRRYAPSDRTVQFDSSLSPTAAQLRRGSHGSGIAAARSLRQQRGSSGGGARGVSVEHVADTAFHPPVMKCSICSSQVCGRLTRVNDYHVSQYLEDRVWLCLHGSCADASRLLESGARKRSRGILCSGADVVTSASLPVRALRLLRREAAVDEITALASLTSSFSGLLRLYGAVLDSGAELTFLVYEPFVAQCPGATPSGRIKGDQWAEERVVDVCGSVLSALGHLHAKNIVHGSVRPQTVVLMQRSCAQRFKLCVGSGSVTWGGGSSESGCATPVHHRRRRDVYFTAPEQRYCSDRRSDVWALGALCYMLLFGEVPFGAGATTTGAVLDGISAADTPAELRTSWETDSCWTGVSGEGGGFVTDSARSALSHMLERSLARRVTSAQALQLPWLADWVAEARGRSGACSREVVEIPAEVLPVEQVSPTIEGVESVPSSPVLPDRTCGYRLSSLPRDVLMLLCTYLPVSQRPRLQLVCAKWGPSIRATFCWRVRQKRLQTTARPGETEYRTTLRAVAFRWYAAAAEYLYSIIEDELHTAALGSEMCCVTLRRVLTASPPQELDALPVHGLVMLQAWVSGGEERPLRELHIVAVPASDGEGEDGPSVAAAPCPVYWPLGNVRVTPCAFSAARHGGCSLSRTHIRCIRRFDGEPTCFCPASETGGPLPEESWLGDAGNEAPAFFESLCREDDAVGAAAGAAGAAPPPAQRGALYAPLQGTSLVEPRSVAPYWRRRRRARTHAEGPRSADSAAQARGPEPELRSFFRSSSMAGTLVACATTAANPGRLVQ
eukprot:TRINITY_DN8380_c0_g1_i1.p1 TRINITY_DN8380_c0_g1~~TRINITY_DN8380_c0_g1_i1.p1  ORF type:complete len:827 (+),score=168.13 TRINITY_DN8380_c0_g1_i1:96-2483(+)